MQSRVRLLRRGSLLKPPSALIAASVEKGSKRPSSCQAVNSATGRTRPRVPVALTGSVLSGTEFPTLAYPLISSTGI